MDERRVIDEGVASVPLSPVSNSGSPSSPSPSPACWNRYSSLLFLRSRRPTLAWCWRSRLLLHYACHNRVSDLRLLLAAAAFLVETLTRLDERRVIDGDVASVPLPPVANSVSPSSLSTSRACSNRCDSLLFWWSRSPSFAWCWRCSLLLPCACHSRMSDLRLLLATTTGSRHVLTRVRLGTHPCSRIRTAGASLPTVG